MRFEQAGITGAKLDARMLLAHVLRVDLGQLVFDEKKTVSQEAKAKLEELTLRRLTGEPVARLLSKKQFYGLEFGLNEATLVPRPETELLVDLALDLLDKKQVTKILELGTGSGCVIVSLLVNLDKAQAVATDISTLALEQAKSNATKHGVEGRISWCSGSWFSAVPDEKFDLIVCNPPYIVSEIIPGLNREVAEFDPVLALDGGKEGLDAYREVIKGAASYLAPNGHLVLEIGFDQAQRVAALCRKNGFEEISHHRDLASLPRAIVAAR